MKDIHSEIISYFKNKNDPIILDVGSYLGEDALEFNERIPNSTIFCFEADPRNVIEFRNKINNPNIHLIEGAISNYDGTTNFYFSNDIDFNRDWRLSGSINKPTGHLREYTVRFGTEPIVISCQRLDTWYKNSSIYNRLIHLQWVDLNGAEKEFLEGAKETLSNTYLLFIECFDKELYSGQVNCDWANRFLSNLGFEFVLELGHNQLYKNKNYE